MKSLNKKNHTRNVLKSIRLIVILLIAFETHSVFAQTTLSAGDIAFIGVNTDKNGLTIGYGFSVVFLKEVSSGTTFSITDHGWIDASSSFRNEDGDKTLIWTATSDVSAGAILNVQTTDVNGATIPPIPSIGSISGATFIISGIGDQIFIYQGPSSNPTFITGIHWNLEPTSNESNWDDGATVSLYNTTSDLPNQLTNGVNAIWVYNTAGTTPADKERDDFRYKSTALTTGSPTQLSTAINTLSNWDVDLTGSIPFTLNPFPFSFTVTTGNSAPTASSFTASPIYQNTAFTFATANFGYTDADADPLAFIRVTAVPGTGTLWVDTDASGTVNGAEMALTNGGTITKANLDAGYLKYLSISGSSSSFTFDVNDGTDYSASTYTATLNIIPIPTITNATYDATIGVLIVSGTGLLSKAGIGNDIDVSKLTFTGEGGTTYTLTSTNDVEITSNTSFTVTLSATDRAVVNKILNKNGTSSTSGTAYNLAAAEDWAAGADAVVIVADLTDNGITISNVAIPTITRPTYNASTGVLTVSCTGLLSRAGSSNDIDVSKLTFTGEGGTTYTLTSTSDVEITSGTSFSVTLSGADMAAVNQILNKNGSSSTSGTAYNLAAAEDWAAGAEVANTVADLTGNIITVSNVAIPTITNATYNYSTNVMTVIGTGFLIKAGAANDIDISKFTITGEGGATYTLMSNNDVEITSSYEFSITLTGTDLTNVEALLNNNGTTSATSGTLYNLAAAEDWAAGAYPVVVVADLIGNSITVSNYASPVIITTTYNVSTGVLVATGTNFVVNSGTINDVDASLFTFTGRGGTTYALSTTGDVEISSATKFALTLSSIDYLNVSKLFNKNGTSAFDGTAYNLAAADNWMAASPSGNDITDAITGITVSYADVAPPAVSGITLSGTPASNESSLSYSVSFNEPASNISTDDFQLTTISGTAAGSVSSVIASSGTSVDVNINSISGTGSVRLDLKSNTNITDASGNGNGTNGYVAAYSSPNTHPVDTDAPKVTSVIVPVNATYIAGQNLDFTINFSENVTVVTTLGTPQLAITIGVTTRQAVYQSGSGTDALVFRYTVQAGEHDADGISIGALAANSGILRDTAFNDANLTLNSVGATTGVLVDATPTVAFSTITSSGLESVSSAVLQVDLSAASVFDITVDYAVTGTATGGGNDYSLTNGTLTVTAGNTTANINITGIVDDVLAEGDETVIVTLSNPSYATLGTNTTHSYTIIDNDELPTVTTQAVSNITSTSFVGNGNITGLGAPSPTQHGVCWNTSGTPTIADDKTEEGVVSALGTFTSNVSSLTPNKTYYVRAYAKNIVGTVYGDEVSFTTLAQAPTVITNAATSIIATGATLNGTVNAENASTVVSFEYGLTTAYGTSVDADQSPVTGVANIDVSTTLTGLEPNTTYHYRVGGVNVGGTTYGSDQTFTTDAIAPTVTTLAATDITAKGVTFHGKVNANNASTIVRIEMGTTMAYGIISEVDQSPISGSTDVTINYSSYGYTPNTTYHYRVIGINAGGTTYGADMTFTTLTQEPLASTVNASNISASSVTLNGSVNANELSTTVTFEYGLTSAYGTTISAYQSPLTQGYSEDVNALLSGLAPNTTYHYRVVAVNSAGTATGGDLTFTTASQEPTVTTEYASGVDANSAMFRGYVNPNDYSTTVTFEYGLTTAYGNTITADQSPVTGNVEQAVSADITGLNPYTTYHYRAVGVSIGGSATGADITFTTSSVASTVSTQAVSAVTETSATGNGNITDLGLPNPTAHGVCWNTNGVPTVYDHFTDEGNVSTTGAFKSAITSLSAGTTYYVRAYATNESGTVYGNEVSFTTLKKVTITTQNVTNVGQTTAVASAWIGDHGNPILTQCGVCWSTSASPTIADSKTEEGTMSVETTTFYSNLTGLSPHTTYYVRAYATNEAGTSYGDDLTFTTDPAPPTVTTQSVSSITKTSATGNGNITDVGVPNPTAYGVCWNTTGTPTIADNFTDEGASGTTGAFISEMTSLNTNTTYYVRAYVTNLTGTVYGAEVSFSTLSNAPVVTTNAASDVEPIQASLHGAVNANDLSTSVTFEYGLTTAYGNSIAADQSPVTGTTDMEVSVILIGLRPNTMYHFRVVGENSEGSVSGDDQTFTTTKYDQLITFNALPDKITSDVDFAPGATSDLGLIISYESSNELVATILNAQIHILGVGTAEITASQPGNDTVNIATPVSQTLTVTEITDIESTYLADIKVYPNPASKVLNLEFGNLVLSESAKVTIVDLNGNTVFSEKLQDTNLEIDISNFSPGVYLVTLVDNNGANQMIKIVKE